MTDKVTALHQAPPSDKDDHPTILHTDGELPRILDETEVAVEKTGLVYQYANRLCRVHVVATPEKGLVRRAIGAARIHYVDQMHYSELATIAARHVRLDRRSGEMRAINFPPRYAQSYLSRGQYKARVLAGISEAPVICSDFKIVWHPGYDSRTGLYLHLPDLPKNWLPPARPTLADARAAVEELSEAFATFPFEDESDLAAVMAAVITGLARRDLSAAPGFGCTAPAPATGKSKLIEAISMIIQGHQGAMMALSDDEDENEKRLNAVLLAGDTVVIADNCEQPLRGVLLCQMMTASSVKFRPLGHSSIVEAPTNVLFLATGNNLSCIGDMRRRLLLIRLNAKIEKPDERTFERDAVEYVKQHRWRLIKAALTIPLAYHVAQEPHTGQRPFGGFENWDGIVRRPLVFSGCADPLLPAASLRERDPDLETTKALFDAWRTKFGDAGATVSEALSAARRHYQRMDGDGDDPVDPSLRSALQAAATDKLEGRRLGSWLRNHKDRIVDGLVLVQGEDKHTKTSKWTVLTMLSLKDRGRQI